MKFVHAADVHLDSPLRGLTAYEGAPVQEFRMATRRAFVGLIDACLAEAVDALILAGDLYDGDWRDYNTGLFFVAQMARLRAAGIYVFLTRGNHDAESQLTKRLRLPEGVVDFPTHAATTVIVEALGLAVHGRGFPDRNMPENFAAAYPPPVPDLFNLGVLHTSADGREGHAPYAPCRVEELVHHGYDYWALGHVHGREVLHTAPWVVFPGNLQGRHARETGPKGATFVTVEDGRIRSVEARAFDVVRWAARTVDLTEGMSALDALDEIRAMVRREKHQADGRTLALRLHVQGRSVAHAAFATDPERWTQEVRAAATEAGGGELWVEKLHFATGAPLDRDELRQRDDPLGGLLRSLGNLHQDDLALAWLWEQVADLRRKLPPEAATVGGLTLQHPTDLRDALGDVEELLVAQLSAQDTEV